MTTATGYYTDTNIDSYVKSKVAISGGCITAGEGDQYALNYVYNSSGAGNYYNAANLHI